MFSKHSLMGLLRRVKPFSPTSTECAKRILLLASLRPGSGNAATASRIAYELRKSSQFTVDCLSVDAPHTESDSFPTLIRQYDAILALHIYRAGCLLTSIYGNDENNDLPPLILIFAGTELHSCEPKWLTTLEYILPHARGLVCFSIEWKKYVETTYKDRLACKITVIPQSVLLSPSISEQLPAPSQLPMHTKSLIWVGEMRSVKDPLFALRICSHLNDDDYHLFLVGYQIDRSLVDQIHSSCSQTNFTLVGGQSHEYVHALMRTSFAFVNTSINEGMCLAMLEAMLLGLPVVARRNTGNMSIIKDGKTGLLFDTPDEAAQCLVQLEKNIKLKNTLIRQAENQVKKCHNLPAETKAYRNLLRNLIES